MAQYDAPADQVAQDLTSSDDITETTKLAIDESLANSANAEGNVVVVEADTAADLEGLDSGNAVVSLSTDIEITDVNDGGVPILLFRGDGDVVASLTAAGNRTIIAAEGNDQITIGDAINAVVEGGGGDDSISAGAGTDSIFGGAGDDSISSGGGADSILAGIGNDSIDAGTGVDQVSLGGSSSDYDVQVVDGKVIITSTDDFAISTLENADYVSFDDGSAIINANGRDTGSAGRMLESDFGEGTYDAYAAAIGNTDENDDVELVLLAQEIINSSSLDGLDGADFVNALYQGVFGRDADAGGLDFYVNALADNSKTQAQILADFGWSDEGVDTYDNVNEIDGLV